MPNAIMIALGKAKPKKGMAAKDDEEMDDEDEMSDDEESDDVDVDEGEREAAKAAFNAKSVDEYAKALKAFFTICYMNHQDEEESHEEESSEKGY